MRKQINMIISIGIFNEKGFIVLEIALGKSRPANISTPIDSPKIEIKIKKIIPSNFIILSPHPNHSPFIIC